MDFQLIDTHCHLHFPAYDADREEVLSRMQAQRIGGITIGTALGNSERAVTLADSVPGIWAAVGMHPEHFSSDFHDANEGEVEKEFDAERLKQIARSSQKVVAIGETGLDFFRIDEGRDPLETRSIQETAFRAQLKIAFELGLPVIMHCRESLQRLTEIIQDEVTSGRSVSGVVHSFTGTWEQAKPLLDLGLSLGINGIATFPLRKTQTFDQAIDRTLERLPLNRLLLETDAPYLAPAPYRGQRNEPTYVSEVAKHVARVRSLTLEEIAQTTTENAIELFGLKV